MDYSKLLNKFSTPMYLFDIELLEKRIKYIKSCFDKDIKFIYAIKANTFVLKQIEELIDGFEICSFGEFEICNNLKLNQNKFVISGVNKDFDSIKYIFENTNNVVKFTVESINQYKLLTALAKQYNKKIELLIRLTSGNQFGVSETDFEQIISYSKNESMIKIIGIQYFSGTQKKSVKKLEKELNYLEQFINYIEEKYKIRIEHLEYGPGAPISYFVGEEFDELEYFKELNNMLSKIKNRKISLEIGRSIVASCGFYLTKVVDIKSNQNGNILLLAGGMNHLVYYGQTMAMRIPYLEQYPIRKGEVKHYTLYGSLCTINDILIKNLPLEDVQINDVFIFKNVGAYCSTEGISLFLSRELPKIILKDKDGNFKLVRDNIKTSNLNFPYVEE